MHPSSCFVVARTLFSSSPCPPRPKEASARPIRLRANTITAVQLSLPPTSGRLRAGESTSARPLARSGTPPEIPLQKTPTPADT